MSTSVLSNILSVHDMQGKDTTYVSQVLQYNFNKYYFDLPVYVIISFAKIQLKIINSN